MLTQADQTTARDYLSQFNWNVDEAYAYWLETTSGGAVGRDQYMTW